MRELTFIRSSGRIGVAGFTLVELLVAVMLISVMMFVAVPRLMGLKKSPMVRALDAIEDVKSKHKKELEQKKANLDKLTSWFGGKSRRSRKTRRS